MELMSHLLLGLQTAANPVNLFYCFIGVFLGTAIGVLPGLGPTATIAMLLPVTFVLPPVTALIMLAGIYYGSQYGGSPTSILVNLPRQGAFRHRIVLRRHRSDIFNRGIRPAAGRRRAQVRTGGIFLPDGPRSGGVCG